jgi:hypothetical protein
VPAEPAEPEEGYRNASVRESNFLIEAYCRTEPGHTGGILIEKMERAGYGLRVNDRGGLTFTVAGADQSAKVESTATVNDGRWHHVVAEADRQARRLTVYVDGQTDAQSAGPGPESISNPADLHVGGCPDGGHLAGTIDFMRLALGTLADAKTTIEELYAWQFDGPFLRDFAGHGPTERRDAGALEGLAP